MKDYIFEAFNNQNIKEIKGKRYCVNTITDHTPITKSELVDQIVEEINQKIDISEIDFIVGEEDRGGYLAGIVAFANKKTFYLNNMESIWP